jgi:hypothetical protein
VLQSPPRSSLRHPQGLADVRFAVVMSAGSERMSAVHAMVQHHVLHPISSKSLVTVLNCACRRCLVVVFSLWLFAVVVLQTLGYRRTFRGANTQKDLFRSNPDDPRVAALETMPTERGTQLICSSWWGVTARRREPHRRLIMSWRGKYA